MDTCESNFVKEFKNTMNSRKNAKFVCSFAINKLPIPVLPDLLQEPTYKIAKVKGVKERFFEDLNNTNVFVLGRMELKKRKFLADGSFRLDANGKQEYTDIHVPKDSVAVISDKNIKIKRNIMVGEVSKEHSISFGFMYVDYIDNKVLKIRQYIYIVPKEYVYKLNLCALVLSATRHKNYYVGYKIALQNGTYVYLHVIPFKYRENANSRVLGVKESTLFGAEIKAVLSFWEQNKVIFNIATTQLIDESIINLGIKVLDNTCFVEDFEINKVSMLNENIELIYD